MVLLDSMLVSSYRMSIVTMQLIEALCPQISNASILRCPQLRGMGIIGGPNWYHKVAVKQPYLFLQTLQTTDE